MRALKLLVAALALQAAMVASAQPIALLHPTNSTWRYLADNTDQGTAWSEVGFDDSLWPQGVGLFGNDGAVYAPLGFNTAIPGPAAGGPITVYFRTHFTWSGSTIGVVLSGTNYVDDGNVVYLNNVEITRFNMPEGPPTFATTAPAPNPGGFPNASGGEPVRVIMQIPLDSLTNGNANPLVVGDNVLAVEVHNQGTGSSDVVFGMELRAQQAIAPCTDGIQPTNRVITEGLSTTFVVVEGANCGVPAPTFQWYRITDIGGAEELITGATGSSYTLNNAAQTDSGLYYCRLTNPSGVVDSRQARLDVLPDTVAPVFLAAQVVGPGLNTFRLIVNEALCIDADPMSPTFCGTDARVGFNWHIFLAGSRDPADDLGVPFVTQINATTYEFTTSFARDPSQRYDIVVDDFGEIGDVYQNRVAPGTFITTGLQRSFQQGDANGYTGTQDAEIHSNAQADTPLGGATTMTIDNDDAGIAQALIRFENIFGPGATQIPPGSRIVSATLTVNQNNEGSFCNFHRMLVTWDQATVTWNSMVNGISADDVEAVAVFDGGSTGPGVPNGPIVIDVTAGVQAWADGQPNHGWGILSTGGNGWDIDTSEGPPATAPMLSIEYLPATCSGPPVVVTQPPASLSVNELGPLSITAAVSNVCDDTTFQWTRNGSDIAGANSTTYSVANAGPGDAGTYRLRLTNPRGTATSDPSVVTVVADTTRPRVTRVVSSANGTTITVSFNEAVTAASAQNTANYTLVPAVAVSSAVLGANNTVTLTTSARNVGTAYSLRISGVRDVSAAGNLVDPDPTVVSLTTASVVAGAGFGGTWLYNSNNLDSTAGAWKNPGFVPDATWGTGPAAFGIETSAAVIGAAPTPIMTALTANSVAPGDQLTTTYFRKDITLPALPAGARYVICHYTDDGHITYLDGVEINRYAMPAGAVTFTNRSTGIPNGGEASMRSFTFTATPGAHVLAVELHQAGNTTSSDVWFDMEVRIVDSGSPSLSISRNTSPAGSLNLNWNADANWMLRSSATVNGQYNNVAIPAGTAQGTFLIPAGAAGTGNNFYLLDYICLP